jgi:ADP-heptose:LPS heptosyltransferase
MTSVKAIRWLDHWIGVPLCFTLTGVRRLRDLSRREPLPGVRAIVFIKLVEQGSTVLACSAIRRAIELVGRDNVYFLVFQENRFIIDVMELLPAENVISIRHENLFAAVIDTVRAIATLAKKRVNAVIDFEFFARSSAAISFLTGCEYRVGFHAFGGEGPYRGDLMTHRLRYNPYLHTSQTFRTMVEALAFSPCNLTPFDVKPVRDDEPPPAFLPTNSEVLQAENILREAARTETPSSLILLNPNCSDMLPLRRWPAERYIELARRLTALYPELYVALTGTPSEAEAAASLVQQIGSERCFSLAGRTTLRQLLVVFGLADVLVTNDSGPAHFAALTPIDVVTLFGPETPHLYQARTPRNHVFWHGLACSPCVSPLNQKFSSCQNNLCMQHIEVDAVFDKVCKIYQAKRKTRTFTHDVDRVRHLRMGA